MFTRIAWVLSLAACLMGCSSTNLVSSWRNEQLGGYQRILTIGITENVTTRRIFEDVFAAEARTAGATAVPSYTVLPEAGRIPKARLTEAANSTNADAVLIMRLIAVDRQIISTPGGVYPYSPRPAFGHGYYDWAWEGYYEPPRIYEEVSVILETTIYDAQTGEVAWSGKTRTIDPTHLDDEMHEVSKIVVQSLQADGIIGGPPKTTRPAI